VHIFWDYVWHFPTWILIVLRNSLILCKSECSKMRSVDVMYICPPFPWMCCGFVLESYYSVWETCHLSKCVTRLYLDWEFFAHSDGYISLKPVAHFCINERGHWHSEQHKSHHSPQSTAQLRWNTENILTLCVVHSQLVHSKWTHLRPPGSKCTVWMGESAEAR
jgi:hypothetical protein